MTKTREGSKSDNTNTDGMPYAAIVSALKGPTEKLQATLKKRGSESADQLHQSRQRQAASQYPAATIHESEIVFSNDTNDFFKSSLEIKDSSHTVEIVQLDDGGCDLLFSAQHPDNINLNKLPGKSKSAYIITADKQLYYADKSNKILTAINIQEKVFDELMEAMAVSQAVRPNSELSCLAANLTREQLQAITAYTKHLHGMAFFKHKTMHPVMVPIEAANSTAYQLLGAHHFPTCYSVQNSNHNYSGVISKLLPGFKPNRDTPLDETDRRISSLSNMLIERDTNKDQRLNEIIQTIETLVTFLDRGANPQQRFYARWYTTAANLTNYYVGSSSGAIILKPKLEEFTKLNPNAINFGNLDEIRRQLISRQQTIEVADKSITARKHRHNEELELIKQVIKQLNLLLLDEITVYIKSIRKIDKMLTDNWVDVEAENKNPNSKYKNIVVNEGMRLPLPISLEDVLHYRIQRGQAIGLTSRYFLMDPDCHAKNIAPDGRNVDGDLAVNTLTYRFASPIRKPGAKDFILDLGDFINFPNLSAASFRYWPTQATIIDASADTALSQVSTVTKNYYTLKDNANYKELEKLPIFSFQKYIQLIIFSLLDEEIFSACAKLHLTDHLQMLNADGDSLVPVPLTDVSGTRQDVQAVWVKTLTDRAASAKETLADNLPPIRMLLERHHDLVLEMVLEQFDSFMEVRKNELSETDLCQLQKALNPERITIKFQALMHSIISSEQKNTSAAYSL